jgi:altronate dehydratase small subunit
MTIQVFLIDEADNVVTNVADEIPAGTEVDVKGAVIETVDDIPYGHKIALRPIAEGEDVIKYGLSIGSATEDIPAGSHVHIHNVESNRGRGDKYEGE